MLTTQKLRIHQFGHGDPLDELGATRQQRYLRQYLADLEASCIIEEPQYFDRNYLDEFSAFYSASTRGYPNVCRRLHVFSGELFDRARLERLLGARKEAHQAAQQHYLGFVVLRPFEPPLLGRTVLRWYPDQPEADEGPRETGSSRRYVVHLAGVPLEIEGLAWQQQDASVSSCSTVALWSMLQSSAFDDHHVVPTTADIARTVYRASPHRRVVPSGGLRKDQLIELILAHDLSPIVIDGDRETPNGRGFSRERFATTCASLLRSGHPVLVSGTSVQDGKPSGHAMCITGFRIKHGAVVRPGGRSFDVPDESTAYVYVHDDNLGPNVRFEVGEAQGVVRLRPEARSRHRRTSEWPDPLQGYGHFFPNSLLVAVHGSLRTSPDALQRAAGEVAQPFARLAHGPNSAANGVSLSTRFVSLATYLRDELPRLLEDQEPSVLARARLGLAEDVPPLSLYLGVVRLGDGTRPLADILYDTTDRDRALRPCAHLTFDARAARLLKALSAQGPSFGAHIDVSSGPP